jgi:hypothetical protein
MMSASPFRILFVLALVAGCNPRYGVWRTAPLLGPGPPLGCIDRVLSSIPDITFIRYYRDERARADLAAPDTVHVFLYSGPDARGAVQVVVSPDGGMRLVQSFSGSGRKPPVEQIDRARPMMKRIEQELEARCPLARLGATIAEECVRLKCPPL